MNRCAQCDRLLDMPLVFALCSIPVELWDLRFCSGRCSDAYLASYRHAPVVETKAKYRTAGPLKDSGYLIDGREWVERIIKEAVG